MVKGNMEGVFGMKQVILIDHACLVQGVTVE